MIAILTNYQKHFRKQVCELVEKMSHLSTQSIGSRYHNAIYYICKKSNSSKHSNGSKYASRCKCLFYNKFSFIMMTTTVLLLTHALLGMDTHWLPMTCLLATIDIENWEEYKQKRKYDNISSEKILRKFRNTKAYPEILIETSQKQPVTITELSKELKYGRDWVRKIIKWLQQADLVKIVKPRNNRNDTNVEPEIIKKIQNKTITTISKGNLKGAALKMVQNADFCCLSMWGEEFVSKAVGCLGLNKNPTKSNKNEVMDHDK